MSCNTASRLRKAKVDGEPPPYPAPSGRVSKPAREPLRDAGDQGAAGLNGQVFPGMMARVGTYRRHAPDLDAYHERARTGPCFVCRILAGDPDFAGHHIVYEDAAAFLNRWPTQYGYMLVVPKRHREQATADFTVGEYLALQRVVYRVAQAVRGEVGAERMYAISFGSNGGNAHVHWHVVPFPPDTPYDEQQFAAFMLETADALDIPEDEKADLAARISGRMQSIP